MDYLNVIMLVCQISNPSICNEETLKIQSSMKTCPYDAQLTMAEWIGDHPKYHIERYHCEPPREPT